MKNMLTFFLFVLVITFFYSINRKSTPTHIKLIDKEINKFIKKTQCKNKFEVLANGGSMMNDISKVNFHFQDFEYALDLKNARKLLIKNVEIFLQQINSNNEIRPFLHNYPFTEINMQFLISVQNDCKAICKSEMISLVGLREGKILYFKRNIENKNVLIFEENYDDGLKIIQFEIQ